MIIRDPRRRRAAALVARGGFVVSTLAFTASLFAVVATDVPPASATPVAGVAQIITPSDGTGGSGQLLPGGDSATLFSFLLPAGSACSGDSTNDGYTIQSYMVPTSVDPATLTFDPAGTGPVPSSIGEPYASFRQPMYDSQGSAYANRFVADAAPPPGPGLIINIPTLAFSAYAPTAPGESFLPPGDYNVGVACRGPGPVDTAVLDKFWNAQITIAASAVDTGPVGIAWTVQAAAAATSVELTANPANGAAPGANVTLTAQVTPAAAAGTVTFNDQGVGLGTPLTASNGTATFSTSTLADGDHSLTATFTPANPAAFAPSTSSDLPYSIVVGGVTTTTAARGGTTTSTTAAVAGAGVARSGSEPSTGTPLSSLADTGGSLSLGVWGLLAIVFGRMAMLLGRKPAVRVA